MEPAESDSVPFEWMNVWVESARTGAAVLADATALASADGRYELVAERASQAAQTLTSVTAFVPSAPAAETNEVLMRDVAAIELRRDALATIPAFGIVAARRTQALALAPSRTSDAVPVMVGGVLALVMLAVFGAAATMTRLAR